MSPLFFFFVADYCELRIPKKYYLLPMLVIPVLFYLLVLTFNHHHLLYSSYSYDSLNPIHGMPVEPSRLYYVNTFYPLFCVILSCIVLVRSIATQSRGRRFGLILLLISALAPLVAHITYVTISFFFKGSALAGINFTAFFMVLSNFIFFYNVVQNDIFDLSPKAHAITMDLIRDAFVVLDQSMAYTGSNKKAQELFPGLGELQKGGSILNLENWPRELAAGTGMGGPQELRREIEFTLPHQPGKIYSGWTNRVTSESDITLGWVIMIQDITETVSLIRNIQAQRDEIAAMRDNLKEGLFLMDREYRIQPSYARALEEVLSGKSLQGRSFTGLLDKSFSQKDTETIADYFTMIMDKSVEPDMLEDMNPLREFSYISAETGEHKTLRCIFAPVEQESGEIFVMGTIQDISAETALKKQLAEEEERRQDEMRNLFEVMQVDQKVFANFMEDTDYEFQRINKMLKDKKVSNRRMLINLYQSVHAIKSNALIVGLSSYGEKLHALESEIKELRDKDNEPKFEEILHITVELEKRMQDKEKLPEILKRLRDFSAAGGETMKDDEAFTEALKRACERVAADEQKKVIFAVKTFDREALAQGRRREMKEILTQLVRNAVYHGIEKPEERLAQGKDQAGKITLAVTLEDGAVRMILEDDGGGLDFNRIAEKALAQGLIKNPGDKTNRQFLSNIIFNPGFSTSETENIHAGRGIGLNLVRDRLREIKGTMQLRGKKGRGLVFDIKIPLGDQPVRN
jgi:two-component system chemotaxis sensor kinase CheA